MKTKESVSVCIFRNDAGRIWGFEIANHCESIVCAAVSAIVINACNSVFKFVEDDNLGAQLKHGSSGYIKFCSIAIRDGHSNSRFDLLMNSMLFGLESIEEEYPGSIIFEKKNGCV